MCRSVCSHTLLLPGGRLVDGCRGCAYVPEVGVRLQETYHTRDCHHFDSVLGYGALMNQGRVRALGMVF